MGAVTDVSTGMSITFDSGFFAEIINFDWSGLTREALPTSHMGVAAPGSGKVGNMLHIPGDLSEGGEISVEIHFHANTEPPLDAVAETVTVTWPLASGDSSAATWAGSGFMTSMDISAGLDEVMTATITVKMSGNVTISASS